MTSVALSAGNLSDDEFELVPRPSMDSSSQDGHDFDVLSLADSGVLSADSDSDSRPESPSSAASAVIEALEDLRCDQLPRDFVTEAIASISAQRQDAAVPTLDNAVPAADTKLAPEAPSPTSLPATECATSSDPVTPVPSAAAPNPTPPAAAAGIVARRNAALLFLISAYMTAVVTLILLGTGIIPTSPTEGSYWPRREYPYPFPLVPGALNPPPYATLPSPQMYTYTYNATDARRASHRGSLEHLKGHRDRTALYSCSLSAATGSCCSRHPVINSFEHQPAVAAMLAAAAGLRQAQQQHSCSKHSHHNGAYAVVNPMIACPLCKGVVLYNGTGLGGLPQGSRSVASAAAAADHHHPGAALYNPLLACPVCWEKMAVTNVTGTEGVTATRPDRPLAQLFRHTMKVFTHSRPLACKAAACKATAAGSPMIHNASGVAADLVAARGAQGPAAAAGVTNGTAPAAAAAVWNPLLACGVCGHLLMKDVPAGFNPAVSSAVEQLNNPLDRDVTGVSMQQKHLAASCPTATTAATAANTTAVTAATVSPVAVPAQQRQQQYANSSIASLLWQYVWRGQATATAASGDATAAAPFAPAAAATQQQQQYTNSTALASLLRHYVWRGQAATSGVATTTAAQHQQQQYANSSVLASLLWRCQAAATPASGIATAPAAAAAAVSHQNHKHYSNSTLGSHWLFQYLWPCKDNELLPGKRPQQQQQRMWQILQQQYAASRPHAQVEGLYASSLQSLCHRKGQQQQQQQQEQCGVHNRSGSTGSSRHQCSLSKPKPQRYKALNATAANLSSPGGVASAAAAAVAAVMRCMKPPIKPIPALYVPAPPCLLATPKTVAPVARPIRGSNLQPLATKASTQGFSILDSVKVLGSNPAASSFWGTSQLRSVLMLEHKAAGSGEGLTLPMLPAAVIAAPPAPPRVAAAAAGKGVQVAAAPATVPVLVPSVFAPPPAPKAAAAPTAPLTVAAASSASKPVPAAAAAAGLMLPMLPPVCPSQPQQQRKLWHQGKWACSSSSSSSSSSTGGGLTLPMLPPVTCAHCSTQLQQLPTLSGSSSSRGSKISITSSTNSNQAAAWPAKPQLQQQQPRAVGSSGGNAGDAVPSYQLPDWFAAVVAASTVHDRNQTNNSSSGIVSSSNSSSSNAWVTTWASLPMLPPKGSVATAAAAAADSSTGSTAVARGPVDQVHSVVTPTAQPETLSSHQHISYKVEQYVNDVYKYAGTMQQPLNQLLQHLATARGRSLQCKLVGSNASAAAAKGSGFSSSSSGSTQPAFAAIDAATTAARSLLGLTKQLQAAAMHPVGTSYPGKASWEISQSSSQRDVLELCQAVRSSHRELQAKLAAAVFKPHLDVRTFGMASAATAPKSFGPAATAAAVAGKGLIIYSDLNSGVGSTLCNHSVYGHPSVHHQALPAGVPQYTFKQQQLALPTTAAAAASVVAPPVQGQLLSVKKQFADSSGIKHALPASSAAAVAKHVSPAHEWLLNIGWDKSSAAAAVHAAAEVSAAASELQKGCQRWTAAAAAAADHNGIKSGVTAAVAMTNNHAKGVTGYNLGHSRVINYNNTGKMIRAYPF